MKEVRKDIRRFGWQEFALLEADSLRTSRSCQMHLLEFLRKSCLCHDRSFPENRDFMAKKGIFHCYGMDR